MCGSVAILRAVTVLAVHLGASAEGAVFAEDAVSESLHFVVHAAPGRVEGKSCPGQDLFEDLFAQVVVFEIQRVIAVGKSARKVLTNLVEAGLLHGLDDVCVDVGGQGVDAREDDGHGLGTLRRGRPILHGSCPFLVLILDEGLRRWLQLAEVFLYLDTRLDAADNRHVDVEDDGRVVIRSLVRHLFDCLIAVEGRVNHIEVVLQCLLVALQQESVVVG